MERQYLGVKETGNMAFVFDSELDEVTLDGHIVNN